MSIRTTGYSIWFIPSGSIYKKLSRIIKSLSNQFSLSLFGPHITLLDWIEGKQEEIISKAQVLASRLESMTIFLDDLGY